jgi:hypothetical protein
MSVAQLTCDKRFQIRIAENRLTVTLAVDEHTTDGVEPPAIFDRLVNLGLPLDDTTRIRVQALTENGCIRVTTPTVIYEGLPPIDDQPPRLELLAAEKTQATDHYQRSSFRIATVGEPIAFLHPLVEGQDGRDVFGHPLPRRHAPQEPVKLGRNVQLDPDGKTIQATARGSVHFDGRTLAVETSLEINGNVDFSTGHIDFGGDVFISGSVLDLFKVKGNNIEVRGAVEAADIHAERDLHVTGGILGKEKGRCHAGHELTAKYATNVHLSSGGHITVHSEIANCHVVCAGKLTVECGPLLAGHITANGGVACKSLGAPSQIPTLVEAGLDSELLENAKAKLEQLDAQKQKVTRTRQLVETLMRDPKKLSAAQKEKATELLYETDMLDEQINKNLQTLRESLQASLAKAKPEVTVVDTAYPGVTLRFPGLETTLQAPLKGPLKFVPHDIDGEKRIVAQNTSSGSSHTLPTRFSKSPVMDALQRLLNPAPAAQSKA